MKTGFMSTFARHSGLFFSLLIGCFSAQLRGKGGPSAIAVAAGTNYTLFVDSPAILWASGPNSVGQLGIDASLPQSMPMPVLSLPKVTGIAAGPVHALAVISDGTVYSRASIPTDSLGLGM